MGLIATAIELRGKYANVTRELFWIVGGQTLSFIGMLAGIKILTNSMPPASYGELALGLSIAGAMNMFVYGPAGQVVLRFYSVCRERATLGIFFRAMQRLHIWMSVAMSMVGTVVAVFAYAFIGTSWALILVAATIFGVISGNYGSIQSLYTAMRKRRAVALFQTADVWLRVVFALVLLVILATNGAVALFGYACGTLLVVVLQIWQMVRGRIVPLPTGEAETKLRDELLAYGLPFVMFAALAVVGQYADRWLLQAFRGTAEVGIYAAIFQLASAPVAFVMAAVNQLVIPIVFGRAGALHSEEGIGESRRLLRLTLVFLGLFFCIVVAASFLWGSLFVSWLTNPIYIEHADSFWIVVCAVAVFNLAQLASIRGYSLKRTNIYVVPKLIQGSSLIVAGYFLVSRYSIRGMAMALLLSSVLYFVSVFLVHRRHFGDL